MKNKGLEMSVDVRSCLNVHLFLFAKIRVLIVNYT